MTRLETTPAWRALNDLARDESGLHMRALFEADPGRFVRYSLSVADLLIDYSKHRITDETLARLFALARAREVENWRERMFTGEKINFTENRAVLHTALRNRSNRPVRVDGEDAAIACANDNAFGLSAAVFTADTARGWRVAQRIESGICHVNGPTVHDEAQMPFGGVKASGWGRFGGRAGIEAFTDLRWITVQTAPRHYPF